MSKVDLASLDKGRLRHPLYGNRGHWYVQAVKPGFWTDAMEGEATDTVRAAAIQAIDDVVAKLNARKT